MTKDIRDDVLRKGRFYLNQFAVDMTTFQLAAACVRVESHVSVEELCPKNAVSGGALSASGFSHQ